MILLILLLTPLFAMGESRGPNNKTLSFSEAPSYLSCFSEGITWSAEEIIDIITGVASLYSCQDLCLQSTTCHHFSWYSQQSVPLGFLCFLYDHPTLEYPCSNCVSGPKSCTCSDYFSCQLTGDNLIGEVPHVQLEVLCQDNCAKTNNCAFYSWLTGDTHPFPNTCFMFSSCIEKDFSCNTCISGPPDCTNVVIITSTTTAIETSSAIITTPTKITSPATSMSTTTITSTSRSSPTTTSLTCDFPEPPKYGEWFCHPSNETVTCHLECHPGYVSDNRTIVTCTDGIWSSYPTCITAIGLITGNIFSPHNTVEVYGEGIHQILPNLPDDRYCHSIETTDSHVIVCGGSITKTSCLELTSSQQWTPHSTTTSKRCLHSSVSILGQLYLLAGQDSKSSTEHLAPSTSTIWLPGPDLLEETSSACAAKIHPEVYIVTGGEINLASVISYNVSNNAVNRLQDLNKPRYGHGCVYIRDSQTGFTGVLVAGGTNQHMPELSDSELYSLSTGQWTTTGTLTAERYQVKLIVLGDSILALGGHDGFYELSTVDRFNATTREWTATEEMLEARMMHAVTGVPLSLVTQTKLISNFSNKPKV